MNECRRWNKAVYTAYVAPSNVHDRKRDGLTDGLTDGPTDVSSIRDTRTHLYINKSLVANDVREMSYQSYIRDLIALFNMEVLKTL